MNNLCNLEAEQIILGALISNAEEMFCCVEEILDANDFFESVHKEIFNAILVLKKKDIKINHLSVLQQIYGNDEFLGAEIKEKNYLQVLMSYALVEFDIRSHIANVKDLSVKRNFAKTLKKHTEIINSSFDMNAVECIDACESDLFKIAAERSISFGLSTIAQSIKKLITKTDDENKGTKSSIKTGFFELDNALNGLNGGELVILAARPGMGKTTLMLNFAYNIVKEFKKSVGIFSLEMQQTELSLKLASIINKEETNVNLLYKLEKNNTEKEQVMNMLKSTEKDLENTQLFINDVGGVSLGDIKREARRLKKKNNLSILFIDYLQLMKIQSKLQNRNLEIQEITQGLKILAKELEIPIFLLSQLSRDTDKRTDKRPVLSDLRDSGAIEQDADIVLFAYRENYYNKEKQSPENTEIIIAKNRKGRTGIVNLLFYPDKSFFKTNTIL